jgi:hypothetical protein
MGRPHPALAERGHLSRGVFVVVTLFSLAALFAPAGGIPATPSGLDKAGHLALFAVLACSGRWTGIPVPVLGPVLLVYATVSEALQGTTALGRTASLADWLADVVGILAGLLLWGWAGRGVRP